MHLKTFLVAYSLIFFHLCESQGPTEDPVVLRAVRGKDATLPCGQGRLFLDGPKSFIVWMRNETEVISRFPNAHSDKRGGKHDEIFGLPCEAGFCDGDTSLRIKMASDHDAGLYRCRIHNQASSNVDYVIQLKIVEPNKVPKIYNEAGEIINSGIIGPLPLQSNLTLICEVENKDQATEVYWRRHGAAVTDTLITQPGCNIRVEFRLTNLTRADLNTEFECMASNSDVSEPLVTSVILTMYMPPLSVEIRLDNNSNFEANQPRVVDCVVVGSVPNPIITWRLGKSMILPSLHKELHDGNYTVSSLTLTPSLLSTGKSLVCQAHNEYIPDRKFEDEVVIFVGYRPYCSLKRQPKIGSFLGDVELAVCFVDADPEPLQFTWTFADSNKVYTRFTKTQGYGNRYQSRLTWLFRGGEIGILSCRASNMFGVMKKPCVFRIVAGGPPQMPDCKITKEKNLNPLRIKCEKGWDGGRPQKIHLDIVGKDGVRVPINSTALGKFFVTKYNDKYNLTGIVYATNSRGKSEEKVLNLYTPPAPQADNHFEHSPAWLKYGQAAAGAFAMLFFFAVLVLAMKFVRSRRYPGDLSPDIIPNSSGSYTREPDVLRDDRLHGMPRSTCITVNTLTGCQNQYSSSPKPACRVLLDNGVPSLADHSSQHSYYV